MLQLFSAHRLRQALKHRTWKVKQTIQSALIMQNVHMYSVLKSKTIMLQKHANL